MRYRWHIASTSPGYVNPAKGRKMKQKYAPFKIREYRLWTYDVWGNARDGFDVNDRASHGYVTVKCRLEIFNAGTAQEFATWEPTDRQLARASGFVGCEWEGQEGYYDAAQKSNGRPVGLLDEENRPELDAERKAMHAKYLADMDAANARQRAQESGEAQS